jgi:hypothetical protein
MGALTLAVCGAPAVRSAEAAGPCGAGAGSVDQSQLLSNGDLVVSAQQTLAQSFVVGKTGILTGIEIGTDACNGVDPTATMHLGVLANGATIGSATMSANAIPVGPCGSNPLSATTIGAGFFDLSALCLSVTAGQVLSIQLSMSSTSVPTCNLSTLRCTGGVVGNPCEFDQDCAYAARAGAFGSPATTNPYPNGVLTANGNPTAPSIFALSFKTFVRSSSVAPVPAAPGAALAGLGVLLALAGSICARRSTRARRNPT